MYGSLISGYGGRTYGSLQLTESSPVQSWAEPLSLAEVQSFLKIPARSPVDSAEDALLTELIHAARETAEIFQGRDLVRKQYDLSLDYWPCPDIELRTPLVSVDLLKYRDSNGNYTTLTGGTDYAVDLARGVVSAPYGTYFPNFTAWPSSAILIRFTSGLLPNSVFWIDAGARLKIGMRLLISDWYNERLPRDTAVEDYPAYLKAVLSAGGRMRIA